MNTLRDLYRRRIVTGAVIFGAIIVLALPVNAQRPSIGELQAQIIGSQGPLTPAEAQVRTALDLLPPFQEAVAQHFRATGEVPAHRVEAGLTATATDTSTSFITSVGITNGTITVMFGNYADPLITAQTLSFTPYETVDSTIVWRCGVDPAPPGTVLLGTSGGGQTAVYIAPTIPASTYPNPCILQSQGNPDEVIRAQVLEPFDVAETIKNAVEAAGVALGSPTAPTPPANRIEAGLTCCAHDTTGRHFHSVGITNGTITITYGNEANLMIQGETLSFTPYESVDGTIIWRCGMGPSPAGASLMGTYASGVVATYEPPSSGMLPKYLPHHCRP